MVARYHGHNLDMASLRERFSTSLKGTALARLIAIAGELKFATRALRLDLQDLGKLRLPCLLHWNLDHFVVLKKVTRRGIIIHDPARGNRETSMDEVSKSFTGIALELAPRPDFIPVEWRERLSLRRLAGPIVELRRSLTQVFLIALALEIFGITTPFYVQWVTDQVLVVADRSLLTLLAVGFGLITLFSVAFTALRSWVVMFISTTLSTQWAANIFGHLMRLPLSFFETRHVGDIVSRASSVQNIQNALSNRLVSALLDGIMSVVTIVVLLIYSAKLALAVVAAFLLYALLRWAIYAPIREANEELLAFGATQQSRLLEAIRGACPIKLFNKQDEQTSRYANALVDQANAAVRVQRLTIVFTALQSALFGIENIVLVWLAARQVIDGNFTAGMLFAVITYGQQFTGRAGSLIDALIEFRMLRLYAERLADIALTAPEPCLEGNYSGPAPQPTIELRNVSFRYAEGEPWILRHCDLRVEAGQSVAIIGPSGCGKSTLVRILLGLLQPQEGEVLIGGISVRQLGLVAYRNLVAAVTQDDRLFAGSIASNIAFFDGSARQEDIEAAALLAGIHQEIGAMPMGYRSLVGDMGSALSGGQRQRVVLARALFRKPKVLVLDEATSHLDIPRERQITEAIAALDMTRIMIAHRLETVARADAIYLLHAGTAKLLDREAFLQPRSGDTVAKAVHFGV